MAGPCPICKSVIFGSQMQPDRPVFDCDCARCGKYSLTDSMVATLRGPDLGKKAAAIASHAIRRMQAGGTRPEISTGVWARIQESKSLPSPAVQAENLLLFLGDSIEGPGQLVNLGEEDRLKCAAIIGALDDQGLRFVIDGSIEQGLIKNTPKVGQFALTPSFSGWQEYERLRRGKASGRRGFMAMKYANEVLMALFLAEFKPAARAAGFELFLLTEDPKAGLIDNRLRVEIRSSRFLVADLTDANPGAYWEAGYAEGLGKPVIYTCARDVWEAKRTHFDTAHSHTIIWDEATPMQAGKDLLATIQATLPEEATMPDHK